MAIASDDDVKRAIMFTGTAEPKGMCNLHFNRKIMIIQFSNRSQYSSYRCHASARSKIEENKIKQIKLMNGEHNH